MNWTAPFAIYRVSPQGEIIQVHVAADIKAAKYWLTYIAQPGDVLCKTPAHPKHSKSSLKPEYWAHKEVSGSSTISEERWVRIAKDRNCSFAFPEGEISQS